MALAFADPKRAPRARLYRRIRTGFSTIVMLCPLYFVGTCTALLVRHCWLHEHYPLWLYVLQAVGLILSLFLAFEVASIENYYERFGI